MLTFHNQVVELLITVAVPREIFAETKKIVTRHYQWCAIPDFLPRVCGAAAFSNWTVDFNMFFNTAHPVGASFNNARTIASVLANGLEAIPGGSGIMAILAARNLRRGLALGLPSGQGAAHALGLTLVVERVPDARVWQYCHSADVSLQFADLTSSLWQFGHPRR
jgi:hypothetical protein